MRHWTMIHGALSLLVTALLIVGCLRMTTGSTPYPVDMNRSGGIVTRDFLLIHLVKDAHSVIQLSIPVPEGDTEKAVVPIGSAHKISAILCTGPNIAERIMRSFNAVPTPPTADQTKYSYQTATDGLVSYTVTGNKQSPQRKISLFVDQLQFGNGVCYSIDRLEFVVAPAQP